MRKTKIVISLLLVVVMVALSVATLVACKKGDEIELLVWAPANAQSFYKGWAEKWAKDYKDSQGRTYTVRIGIQGEGSLATELTKAPADGADVFAFAGDQLSTLIDSGVISQVGDPEKTGTTAYDVAHRNSQGSVDSALMNGKLYAYPMQADNGYFLYYNTDYLTADDVKDWDTLWAKVKQINAGAEGAGVKRVLFDFDTAWYQASWFFTFGGEVSKTATNFATDDVGLKALKAAHDFSKNAEYILSVDPNDATQDLIDGSVIAGVAGGWIYSGDKGVSQNEALELTVLPDVVYEGVKYPMYSFLGTKLMGVNSQREYQEASHALANYLTSEQVQIDKAGKLAAGPSNIKAAESDVAANLPTVRALAAQAAHSKPESNLPKGFWDALPSAVSFVHVNHASVGDYFPGGNANDTALRQLLQNMLTAMKLDS